MSIASYRDPECPGTVTDVLERAEFPQRIRIAIIERRVTGDTICTTPPQPCEQNPQQALCQYAHLLDYFTMDARLGVGPVFARHLAHRYYRGEYYALQIDAHVRMTQHWDTDIIQQWEAARNESESFSLAGVNTKRVVVFVVVGVGGVGGGVRCMRISWTQLCVPPSSFSQCLILVFWLAWLLTNILYIYSGDFNHISQ